MPIRPGRQQDRLHPLMSVADPACELHGVGQRDIAADTCDGHEGLYMASSGPVIRGDRGLTHSTRDVLGMW